ncbi:MAG: BON domain-containing protein [Anaerolineae bacterium]|nr:BON domain-containing protein [Anaerolineae bacterium]
MAETNIATTRPDADIAADIEHLIRRYPPMMNDRHHVKFTVLEGKVTLIGYLKTPITQRYLTETISQVKGVTEVNASGLFDDEDIRLGVGQVIPVGVYCNIEYGAVVLTGHLPAGIDVAALTAEVEKVPGVRYVKTNFVV